MVLSVVVFITGAAIMVLEILGTRILAPFYGTTLYVWASMISTALIFLSLGYFLGGILADRKPEYKTLYLILFASGLTVLTIPLLSTRVLLLTEGVGPRFGPLAASFLLFSLQFTLLGGIAPYAIQLKTRKVKHAGFTAGSLYGIATLGSFFGTIISGFLLIPNLGVMTILFLVALPLILLPTIWFFYSKRYRPLLLLLIIAIFYPLNTPPRLADNGAVLLYSAESAYGNLKVVEKDDMRFLLVNGESESCVVNGKPCLGYIYTIAQAPALFEKKPGNTLFIGLGAGTLPTAFTDIGIETTVIEIDPVIARVAKDYFNFTGSVVIADGRHFLRTSDKRYDIIVQDTGDISTTAPHLHTIESFQETKEALSIEGVFVLNTLGWVEGKESIFQKSVYTTLKQVYTQVYVIPLSSKVYTNVIFFASDRVLDLTSYEMEEGGIILTDNFSPLEFWTIRGAEVGRAEVIEYFGSHVLLG